VQLSELQKPGPRAQFQTTPLTSLDPSPFAGKPGPKTGDDKQVNSYFHISVSSSTPSSPPSPSLPAREIRGYKQVGILPGTL
jgi:hypothetical protein